MSTAVLPIIKLVLFGRCLGALLISMVVQFLLLAVFVLLFRIELLHPLDWIWDSLGLVCSVNMCLMCLPLLGAVLLYGLTLFHQYLAEPRYFPNRYRWLVHHGPRKLWFLCVHLGVGYLTAWVSTDYLQTDYRHLLYKCRDLDCLNSYHFFLLGMGIATACFYFAFVYLRREMSIDFEFIQQEHMRQLRDLFYGTLMKAPLVSLLPTFFYISVYLLFGDFLLCQLSVGFGVDRDDRLVTSLDVIGNGRLLFYAWLLGAQIVCQLHFMRRLFAILLSDHLPMIVTPDRDPFEFRQPQLTIAAGLATVNVYLVQCLTANLLYVEAGRTYSAIRAEIFQLTKPSNRPVNWRVICYQCLSIINSFIGALSDSIPQISSTTKAHKPYLPTVQSFAQPNLLCRQRSLYGIRQVGAIPAWTNESPFRKRNELWLQHIPGYGYLFCEPRGARTEFLLQNALPVIWLTQALAQICVASIKEDRYGVVRDDLSNIVKSLLRLQGEIARLVGAMPNIGSTNNNLQHLRRAVHRSLYNICNSFYNYLGQLAISAKELRQLQAIVHGG